MKPSLAIALAVKRKAKKMSSGGMVEGSDDLLSMDDGGQSEEMEQYSESADELFSADPENESNVAKALASVRRRNLGK